jgi:hypothetical protein
MNVKEEDEHGGDAARRILGFAQAFKSSIFLEGKKRRENKRRKL